jgi:stress response protein YsnF
MNNGENKFSKPLQPNSIGAEKVVIPVIEEKVEISKKVVDKAKILVSKTVNKHIESYDIPLSSEEIVVKRVPKNELIDKAPEGIRYEGDIMIIPVLKEVAVIEKRIMLVEEIHVSKFKYDKVETRDVEVRTEDIEVKRTEIIPPTNL